MKTVTMAELSNLRSRMWRLRDSIGQVEGLGFTPPQEMKNEHDALKALSVIVQIPCLICGSNVPHTIALADPKCPHPRAAVCEDCMGDHSANPKAKVVT